MAEPNDFRGLLQWRCIGPFRGGRVVTVAGDYQNPNVFYFGGCAGGVWKTSDGGTYWQCVSDGFFNTAAVGALAVAPSDSNVIYAGTGETTIRIDVSHGDGVYKSTDAGTTWKHVGLAETRQIGKIRVHPHNPDIVYVAALGHAFGPNQERGVFKSTDGGATWRHVLSRGDKAGAVDLSIDSNPRLIYAAVWEGYRSFWEISSGGPDSGVWRSTDGGETWADISDKPGLPKGIKGKIAVAASPAQPGRVWALIEHRTKGGLYRSDDSGETWEQVSDNQNLVSRAWYYIHLTADPQDPDTVYINNLSFYKSTDGGKTFAELPTPHGDNHDLWIDPRNPQRMIQGNDGGANVSFNGAQTWSTIYNQPTAQFYHIAADNRDPYYVYGTQQDNSSVAVPSRSHHSCITWGDGYIAGTGESGYIAVRPDDHNIVYVGAIGSSPGGGNSIQRYDHRTRQIRLVTTWPEVMSGYGASEDKYRFAWTYPIVISPHDPNTLYIGGNLVFKTTNEGQSWTPISPDLTRADPKTLQPTGGPVNRDAIGAETYATVFSFVESPHEQGVFWAGSDDGLLHISKDAGQSWDKITPPDMPEWSMISCIEISPHDQATAYLAATRYKLDDYRPYLYKTSDYGQTWQSINEGIAAGRLHPRDPRRPRAPGAALRRHRDRAVYLVRRRRILAALPAEPAGHADPRPAAQGQRPDRRHARPLDLDPRRHHAAAPVQRRDRRGRGAPVHAAHHGARQQRHRLVEQPARQELCGHQYGRLCGGEDAGKRQHAPPPRRRGQPAQGRDHHLPPEAKAGRRDHAHLQGRAGQRGAQLQEQGGRYPGASARGSGGTSRAHGWRGGQRRGRGRPGDRRPQRQGAEDQRQQAAGTALSGISSTRRRPRSRARTRRPRSRSRGRWWRRAATRPR